MRRSRFHPGFLARGSGGSALITDPMVTTIRSNVPDAADSDSLAAAGVATGAASPNRLIVITVNSLSTTDAPPVGIVLGPDGSTLTPVMPSLVTTQSTEILATGAYIRSSIYAALLPEGTSVDVGIAFGATQLWRHASVLTATNANSAVATDTGFEVESTPGTGLQANATLTVSAGGIIVGTANWETAEGAGLPTWTGLSGAGGGNLETVYKWAVGKLDSTTEQTDLAVAARLISGGTTNKLIGTFAAFR